MKTIFDGLFKRCFAANAWCCRHLDKTGLFFKDGRPLHVFGTRVLGVVNSGRKMRVLEIGGSSRPFLTADLTQEYVGLDVDEEVRSAPEYTRTLVQSVEETIPGKYDLVITKYVLEHVADNRTAMRQISECIAEDGHLICLIPCGYHPYSIATRIVGNSAQRWLIRFLRPHHSATTGYRVYYDYCSPDAFPRIVKESGLQVEFMEVHWSASNYFNFFVPLFVAVKLFNSFARLAGWRSVASSLVIHARKPVLQERDTICEQRSISRNRLTREAVKNQAER
jgi:SAM-dependent methyltransferase